MNHPLHSPTGILCLLLLLSTVAAPLSASDARWQGASNRPAISTSTADPDRPRSGIFLGYSRKTGSLWIDDFGYQLRADCRVIGTSTKLGLLSAIHPGERVTFRTAPNPKHPSVPFVIEIRRE